MNPQTIPIEKIVVEDQPRKNFRSIESLAESIRVRGLLQPIVLDHNNVLQYGERRYKACKYLGMKDIPFIYSEVVPDDERAERQLAENRDRDALTWQEECLGMLDVYRKKRQRGVLEGWTWGHREASDMFGVSVGTFNYILVVAKKLEGELSLPEDKRKYHSYTSPNEAYRVGVLGEEHDRLLAESARRAKEMSTSPSAKPTSIEDLRIIQEVKAVQESPTLYTFQRERYESNPLNTVPFEEYWTEKIKIKEEYENTVHLSNSFLNTDSINFMLLPENEGRFDHIITDPPYAIDMDNLDQAGGQGMNVDVTKEEHDVEENKTLLARFFPAAFACTTPSAFVVVCGDVMLWQYMYDLALAAGFAVQRWPIIWRKVGQTSMNNCAGYNTTKDFEIVMVCRKPSATVAKKMNTSIVDGSNVKAKRVCGHPFSKPFELTKAFIELVSIPGQTILEPFAGGGSMALEILKQDRRVVAVEKKVEHFNSMVEMIKREYYLPKNKNFIFK